MKVSLCWNLKVGLEHESIMWTWHESLSLFFFSCGFWLLVSMEKFLMDMHGVNNVDNKVWRILFLYNYLEYNSVVLAHAIIILQMVYVDVFAGDLSPSVLFKSCMHHLDGNKCTFCLLKLERDVNLICLEVVFLSKIEKSLEVVSN